MILLPYIVKTSAANFSSYVYIRCFGKLKSTGNQTEKPVSQLFIYTKVDIKYLLTFTFNIY